MPSKRNPNEVPEWPPETPTEHNNYRLFHSELEDDDLVFFHITERSNLDPILEEGFKPKKKLTTVSYAKNSAQSLSHKPNPKEQDYVVFAVKFTQAQLGQVAMDNIDIHVAKLELQPEILGYCLLPKGFKYT